MHRRDLLKSTAATLFTAAIPKPTPGSAASTRTFYLEHLTRVAGPVLEALSQQRLKADMPIECGPGQLESRRLTTHLEAFARTLCGIAPWLELDAVAGNESELHAHFRSITLRSLTNILEAHSADSIDFGADRQNLVDAAFLALAILRAPQFLNAKLEPALRKQLAAALRTTRKFEPPQNNWLLFAGCVEAALHALHEDWDHARVDDGLRKLMGWYAGDGVYGDGSRLHVDYYNSFVIQPFMVAILDELGHEDPAWSAMIPSVQTRAVRYAQMEERLIALDGTYPPIGRSITYRCGAFHHLADAALLNALPEGTTPEQIRCALAAVIRRTLTPPGTFSPPDKTNLYGWLQIGLSGHQPALGERYISTGSLYLCATAFLPLGLPQGHRFWTGPDTPWASQQLWTGINLPADHAING